MNSPPDAKPNATSERRARPRRWLGRSLVAGVLVAALLAAATLAVGAGGPSTVPTILNTEKIERAIEQSSLAQRGAHAQVSCPSGVHLKKGLVFSCTAVVERGGMPCCTAVEERACCRTAAKRRTTPCCTTVVEREATRIVVTELDGSGHVHYEAP
jgi:hypothetical protein